MDLAFSLFSQLACDEVAHDSGTERDISRRTDVITPCFA